MPSLKRNGSHLLKNASHLVNACGCDCCSGAPSTLTVDFGAGGLTDGTVAVCDAVVGDIVVTRTTGCTWIYVLDSFSAITLQIEHVGSDCNWYVLVSISDGGVAEQAVYRTTPEDIGTFDCTDLPATLSKESENFGTYCTGSLPATIAVEV